MTLTPRFTSLAVVGPRARRVLGSNRHERHEIRPGVVTPRASASADAGGSVLPDASTPGDAAPVPDGGPDASAEAAPDPCAGVSCGMPPAAYCVDSATLRSYDAAGTCAGGALHARPRGTRVAQNGCASGACQGADPCTGVLCDSPPAPVCTNSTTLATYSASGTCAGGTCSYAKTTTKCSNGCQSGACLGDPCAGVTCNSPPVAVCTNTTTLETYGAPGKCSGGVCSYAPNLTTCAHGCSRRGLRRRPMRGRHLRRAAGTGVHRRQYTAQLFAHRRLHERDVLVHAHGHDLRARLLEWGMQRRPVRRRRLQLPSGRVLLDGHDPPDLRGLRNLQRRLVLVREHGYAVPRPCQRDADLVGRNVRVHVQQRLHAVGIDVRGGLRERVRCVGRDVQRQRA